jgi:hypothetical protein
MHPQALDWQQGQFFNFFGGVSVKRKGLCQDGKEVVHRSCLAESSGLYVLLQFISVRLFLWSLPDDGREKACPWGAERTLPLIDAKHILHSRADWLYSLLILPE